MNLTKCDVCEVTSEHRPPALWRSISVRRAREGAFGEWSPGVVGIAGTNLCKDAPDVWPGSRRWANHWGRNSPLVLHLCSDECLLAGLRKLHEGARIVGYEGFHLRPEALNASLVVTAELEREPA